VFVKVLTVFIAIIHEFSIYGQKQIERAKSVTRCAHFPTCMKYINVNSVTAFYSQMWRYWTAEQIGWGGN